MPMILLPNLSALALSSSMVLIDTYLGTAKAWYRPCETGETFSRRLLFFSQWSWET